MTDRQIEVMERIYKSISLYNESMFGDSYTPILEEFKIIIKEQKELNLKEFKDKK